MTPDSTRVEAFAHRVVADLAAAFSGVLVNVGHKLGLYTALADGRPVTAEDLARRTGTDPRYVREWLNNQTAGGYLTHDPARDTYTMPPEHAVVLANPDSPVFLPPAFDVASSAWLDEDKLVDAFRTGRGIGWHEHAPRLFAGTEAFFRPGYRQHLVGEWIPAMDGMVARLERGAKVADIGCGHGASTIAMAERWPKSRFFGFDYHEASVRTARERAEAAGVADRVVFGVADAKSFAGGPYDLVCFMDAFHDFGDPVGAARHAHDVLAKDGRLLLVEPHAGDRLEDNLNPVGRLFYAASTAICTPNSKSQEVGLALGAQAGPRRLSEVLREAGFRGIHPTADTPFNLVVEARA